MLIKRKDSLLVLVDVQEKLTPLVQNSDLLINRCQWMMNLASRIEVPIIISEQYPKGLGKTVSPLAALGTPEHHIEKVHFSCMKAPALLKHLEHFQKNQIILIGIETHVCVLQTALELLEADYEVYVVVDATSSRHELDIKYGLKRMKQAGVHLVTAEMVFFEWIRKAGTPEFKALSKEFL